MTLHSHPWSLPLTELLPLNIARRFLLNRLEPLLLAHPLLLCRMRLPSFARGRRHPPDPGQALALHRLVLDGLNTPGTPNQAQ